MRRLAILFLALSASIVNAASLARPRIDDGEVYTFNEPGWTVFGPAEIGTIFGDETFPVTLSLEGDEIHYYGSLAYRRPFATALGMPYLVSAWVNADKASEDTPIAFGVYVNDEWVILTWVAKSQLDSGWQRIDVGVFVEWPGYDPAHRTLAASTWNYQGVASGRWRVGQIEFREVDLAPPTSDFGSD